MYRVSCGISVAPVSPFHLFYFPSSQHLNESQRAVIAARLANMRQGERTDLVSIDTKLSLEQAAELLNVGRATVYQLIIKPPIKTPLKLH
jgi:hypothetical protein